MRDVYPKKKEKNGVSEDNIDRRPQKVRRVGRNETWHTHTYILVRNPKTSTSTSTLNSIILPTFAVVNKTDVSLIRGKCPLYDPKS